MKSGPMWITTLVAALLCVSCAEYQYASIDDPTELEGAIAQRAFTAHLEKFGKLPEEFAISSKNLGERRFEVVVQTWPLDGTYSSAIVQLSDEQPKTRISEIKFFTENDVKMMSIQTRAELNKS